MCLSLCDVFYCRNCYWILSYLHLVKIYIDNKVYENNLNLRSSFWSRIMGDGQEMLGNLVSDCFYRKFFSCDKLGECSGKATYLETNFVYLAGYSGNDIGLSLYRLWQETIFGRLLLLANSSLITMVGCKIIPTY